MSEATTAKAARARAGQPAEDDARAQPAWLARVGDLVLLGLFLALVFLLGVFPLKDTDFWWHLRTGDWIRQHGQVPTRDLYTFTVPDHPWVDLHWGFEVLLSWGYQLGGVTGLNLAKCAITSAAVCLLITAKKRSWPLPVMVVAWLPALLVLAGRMYVRPETLTLLWLAIDMAVVFRWERRPALAFVLPVVQILWVNTQGLFILGPIIIASALADAALRPGALAIERRRWWRTIGLAVGLTGLACLLNPYFVHGALFPLQLAETMASPLFAELIAELTPIPRFIERAGLYNVPLQLHLVTLGVGALSFLLPLGWRVWVRAGRGESGSARSSAKAGKRGKAKTSARAKRSGMPANSALAANADFDAADSTWRLSPLRLLLFLAFSALSWRATRNSHQFAAVVGTVTAWNFGEWAAALLQRSKARAREKQAGRQAASWRGAAIQAVAFASVALLGVAVATGALYRWEREGRAVGLGEEPLWFPHAAVKFAGRPGMPERFLGFHMGHAALYEYYYGPERKVYADARLEVIGPELFERYTRLQQQIGKNDPGWEVALREMGRPVVLADNVEAAPVGATLLGSSGWRCVWFDPIATVFVHESNKEIAQEYAVDFAARHFRPSPSTDPAGVAELTAAAKALTKYAGSLQGQGRFTTSRPLTMLGLDYARRVVRLTPAQAEGWKLVGQLELSREPQGREAIPRFRQPLDPVLDLAAIRATYAIRQALERAPDDFLSLLMLGMTYRARGMDEAALPAFERLVKQTPINADQRATIQAMLDQLPALRSKAGPIPPLQAPANRSEHERIVGELLAAGRARTAAEFIERNFPAEARAWDEADRLAALWLHLGEPARARAIWQQVLEPPRPGLRAARVAASYLAENDFEHARQSYKDALALEPNLFEALYGLAVLEQDAGRAAAALESARRALEAGPPNAASRDAARAIEQWVAPYAE